MRLAAVLLALGLTAGVAFGQSSGDPLEKCAAEKDDAARLACFDRQMAVRHGAHSATPQAADAHPEQPPASDARKPVAASAPAAAARPQASARPAPGQSSSERRSEGSTAEAAAGPAAPDPDFGLQGEALRKKLQERGRPAPEPVSATVTRLVPLSHAEYAFQLDNGQLWQLTDGRPNLNVKVNDRITITRGGFGDFFFTTSHRERIRVKRIR